MLFNIIYYLASILIAFGVFFAITSRSYLTRLIGLGFIQSGIITFLLGMGKVLDASPPIISQDYEIYSNIVPQALMLTAIVVGVATFAVGIILLIKIHKNFGTIDASILDKNNVTEVSQDESS
ncbi:MAG: cation:proton antiporter subunit C [Rickettsiaceae bacterium]|nr:cation:proton antiporter subunit C [Rickettsiaceae bacterium]